MRHALEQNHKNGCGDERSEHRASEKMFGGKELEDEGEIGNENNKENAEGDPGALLPKGCR